jgi:SseB protein N-terminal domain
MPWTGRELRGTGFADDLGEADIDLIAALDDPQDETGLMDAVAQARLLVPIVAAPTEVDDSGELRAELFALNSATDMAVVTLTSPDGQRALPVFSSLAALSAWDAAARPSPVTSARAAQARSPSAVT